MGPDVHRDPDRLRRHAREAHRLAETLEAGLGVGGRDEHSDPAEVDRLVVAVRRAVAELNRIGVELVAAAQVEHAEADALSALRRALS